jgi:hypothetical protein
MVGDRVECAGHRRVDPLDVADEVAPGRGRMGAAPDPLDQPHPEAGFELLDVQAHGRLGQVEPARGGGKAAELHHVGEGVQMVEAEPAHDPTFPYRNHYINKLYFGQPSGQFLPCRSPRPPWTLPTRPALPALP